MILIDKTCKGHNS